MKVLFATRSDLTIRPGGDTIQLHKTKAALENLGVQVKLGEPTKDLVTWSDVVHVFNAQTPISSLNAIQIAKSYGRHTFLSPIWWDLSHSKFIEKSASYRLESFKFVEIGSRFVKPILKISKFMHDVREVIESADTLLPNSEEEMLIIKKDFNIEPKHYHIVMNAVDSEIFQRSVNRSENGIICCARIEPTKNQLRLIRSAKSLNIRNLTLIGNKGSNRLYTDRVIREASKYGYEVITQHLDQNEMADIIRRHRVHALPSFRESPGLSTLESISVGLNAIVSDSRFCPIDTYFTPFIDKNVFICNPYSIESITRSLYQAINSEILPLPLPREMTWAEAGAQTYAAYRSVAS